MRLAPELAVLLLLLLACCSAAPSAPVQLQATLFPAADVRLTGGPFRQAQEINRDYLLRLEPDRLLSWMRTTAGLPPKGAPYGGWDAGGSGMVGHYLSACAFLAAALDDAELRQRVDYVVSQFGEVQNSNGDGGLYESPDSKEWFTELAHGQVPTRPVTPWYTAHKLLAGLRDAWLVAGNQQAEAELRRLGDWALAVTARLDEEQWQAMLGLPGTQGEFGAPHEALADLTAATGDARYLELACKFRHELVFQPMLAGRMDALNGLHANTQLPKFAGYERLYQLTGEAAWHKAASNFFTEVLTRRTWATGGNSQWEHFFAPDDFEHQVLQACGPETCNTYNAVKLAELLYVEQPSGQLVDFCERALYNGLLPSISPDGGFVYYTSMRPGHYRIYSRPFDAFWCCVGTGMEEPGRYALLAYAKSEGQLRVNLFLPSRLNWPELGLKLAQETTFPAEPLTKLVFELAEPRRFTLSVRCPGWLGKRSLDCLVNGVPARIEADQASYAHLTREWQDGDTVEVALSLAPRVELLPGSSKYVALFYGPVLLAGRLGTEGLTHEDFLGAGGAPTDPVGPLATKTRPIGDVPVLVSTPEQLPLQLRPVEGEPLVFETQGVGKPREVRLEPFYQIHYERYAVYWPLVSPEHYARDQLDLATLEDRTLDRVLVGDRRSERRHDLRSVGSNNGDSAPPYPHWRDATGWFSYVLEGQAEGRLELRCVYYGGDTDRRFAVLVNGKQVGSERLRGGRPGEYVTATYALPPELTEGVSRFLVRFEAEPGSLAGGLFDLRLVRAL